MTIALMSACQHCAQETIDRTLVMIQNADPTGETAADPPELSALEGSALTSIVTASHYSASDRGAEYCDEHVCVCVCVFSVRNHIFGTTRPVFTEFRVLVTYGHGSVLLCRRSDTLCTSR